MDYPLYFPRKKAQEKDEAAIKEGIHNSNLWEARLNLMEMGRKHYRFDHSLPSRDFIVTLAGTSPEHWQMKMKKCAITCVRMRRIPSMLSLT